jgi:uncharacterized protein (TIGR03382 family)
MRTLLLVVAALAPAPAWACGGLFCNATQPVDQAAETIVFGIDEEAGTVDVHVQITYQGSSDDFAWIVPVPAEPELFVSTDALFAALSQPTDPVFSLGFDAQGVCAVGFPLTSDQSLTISGDSMGGGVNVIAEEQVGPYDTVTLEASNADLLVAWLQDAGYDLPEDLEPVLAPYIADGQAFVALKLSSGRDTGDLQPLGMRYSGSAASIPIQLTAIAALPDLPLEVYVLGDSRAVPDNYLHVTLNDAAIDWWNQGANYPEVLSIGADEAGGHAFATEFSGPLDSFRGRLWRDDLAGFVTSLRTYEGGVGWIEDATRAFPSAATVALVGEYVPFPAELADQGVTPLQFYQNLSSWSEYADVAGFSAAEATARLEAEIVPAFQEAEALLERHTHVTRMTSTLDAEEMTVDPLFVLNEDLPQEISNTHTATEVRHCGLFEGDGSERTLELADGRSIPLPSADYLARKGITEIDAIEPLTRPAAILVEDLGAEGTGEIVFDWRDQAAEEARQFGRPGCGCASPVGPASSSVLLLVGAGLLSRRRHRGSVAL